jgi:hypothetical protein
MMMIMESSDRELWQAREGLAWLKEYGAQFDLDPDRINLETLDLGDPEACALAQSHPSKNLFYVRFKVLMGDSYGHDWQRAHGFLAYELFYPALTRAWIHVLTEDREASVIDLPEPA